ncbi:MAG: nucleotide-binding universal stress UspA family protein [Saprospiraceae bacterium]|jgi:nucleotide-binding universal stress UspA family protein
MKSILVPTDFSANTQTALEYAIDLANQFACKLILFNTYKLSHRAGMFIGVERMMRDESKELMEETLEKTQKKLNEGVLLEGKVAKGEAVSTIIRAAKKLEVSMIVMATQGASGLKEVFIGSTTNGVMIGSKAPVLVVPSEFDYYPFRTIALYADEKMVLNKRSFEALRMIVSRYDASICAFYIGTKTDTVADTVNDSLSGILEGIKFSFHEIAGDDKDINQKIKDFVKSENADMLCMIKRNRGFWDRLFSNSVTTKEVFHSNVPILVLHD